MATIRDVAREAGVSIATVSRVFNDSSLVSEHTGRLVREAAARLNYWPNGVARSLITNRTHALGVLLPDMHGEFFSEVIRGVDLAARRHGFHVLVSSSHADSEALAEALRSMSGRIDGVIVMAPDVDAPGAIRGFSRHCPVVLVNPGQPVDECDTLSVDNFAGARDMVRHLLGLGHRRVAIVRGPARNLDGEQRLQGYQAALREAGLEPDPRLELRGDFTEPSGWEAGLVLARLEPRPTAVFVANDHMAIGVLAGLAESGVAVPSGMAVAGFDDIAIAHYTSPPLTSVHVDPSRLGERAVELLLSAKRAPAPAARQHEVMPTSLVIRRSCGAPESRREPESAPERRARAAVRVAD